MSEKSEVPKDVLQLWLAVKDAFVNHWGDPTPVQVRALKYALGILELGFNGSFNVKGQLRLLIDAGLNPLPDISGVLP